MTVELKMMFADNMNIDSLLSMISAEKQFVENMLTSINQDVGYSLINSDVSIMPQLDYDDPDLISGVVFRFYKGDLEAPDEELAFYIVDYMKSMNNAADWSVSLLKDVYTERIKQ